MVGAGCLSMPSRDHSEAGLEAGGSLCSLSGWLMLQLRPGTLRDISVGKNPSVASQFLQGTLRAFNK